MATLANAGRYNILMYIYKNPGCKNKDVYTALKIPKINFYKGVEYLIREGFVTEHGEYQKRTYRVVERRYRTYNALLGYFDQITKPQTPKYQKIIKS